MAYLYYFDEDHMAEWLRVSRTEEGMSQYLENYVLGVDDFKEYLRRIGGAKKLKHLRDLERLRAKFSAPWAEEE
jgi:3-oxoacid CoA-transferase subunit A/glutaconate CoA-transferase subunit A